MLTGQDHGQVGRSSRPAASRRPSPAMSGAPPWARQRFVPRPSRCVRHEPPCRLPYLTCEPRWLDVAAAESHIRVAGEGGDHAERVVCQETGSVLPAGKRTGRRWHEEPPPFTWVPPDVPRHRRSHVGGDSCPAAPRRHSAARQRHGAAGPVQSPFPARRGIRRGSGLRDPHRWHVARTLWCVGPSRVPPH